MKCSGCKMYMYPKLTRCSHCGKLKDSLFNPKQLSVEYYNKIPMILFEETDINKQLSKIYSQPNERFLNPVGHYKGVKNSEAKTQ